MTLRRRRAWSAALALLPLAAACASGADRAAPAPVATPAPLPAPSGIFGVGSILLDVDDTRPSEEMPPGLARTIEAQVWYPAHRDVRGEHMPYFPRPGVLGELAAQGYMAQPRERILEWGALEVQATAGALPGVRAGDFPLLLFAPARGIPAEQYAALLQDLASRGFVVVAVSPRASRASGFRRTAGSGSPQQDIGERARDLSIVLRRFVSATGSVAAIAQRVDLTRAGAFGHAAGGVVALHGCAREAVLRRCASLDGAPGVEDRPETLTRPFLVLASRPDTVPAGAIPPLPYDLPERWSDILHGSGGETGGLYEIAGASTMTFTDAAFLTPAITGALGQRGDPVALQRIAADALEAFFMERDGSGLEGVDALDATSDLLLRVL